MRRKFKMTEYHKLSKAKRLLIRKRSTRIVFGLKVLYSFLNAKTEEDMNSVVAQIQEEVNTLTSIMDSPDWNKLPRKRKKKEKRLMCDYFNAYALIPELVTFIISNKHEREANQA